MQQGKDKNEHVHKITLKASQGEGHWTVTRDCHAAFNLGELVPRFTQIGSATPSSQFPRGHAKATLLLGGSHPSPQIQLQKLPFFPRPCHWLQWMVQGWAGEYFDGIFPGTSLQELGVEEAFLQQLRSLSGCSLALSYRERVPECEWHSQTSRLSWQYVNGIWGPVPSSSWAMWDPFCFSWCSGLTCVPQRDMLKSYTPMPQSVTLCGNRIVAAVTGYDELILE